MHDHDHHHRSGTDFALGALLGGLMGAVAGLLLAPKSGQETRRDIAHKAADLQKEGVRLYKEYESKVEDQMDRAGKTVSKRANEIKSTIEDQAERIQDKAERVVREIKR